MPHFRVEEPPRRPAEAITFELRGEVFECAPAIPEWAGVELAAAPDDDPTETGQALVRFIFAALQPKDEDRFRDLLRRKYEPEEYETPEEGGEPVLAAAGWEPVGQEELHALVAWLATVYSDRPTMRPSSSRRGPGANGATSTDGSSLPAIRTAPAGGTGEAS
jgi:hypothetical protein